MIYVDQLNWFVFNIYSLHTVKKPIRVLRNIPSITKVQCVSGRPVLETAIRVVEPDMESYSRPIYARAHLDSYCDKTTCTVCVQH